MSSPRVRDSLVPGWGHWRHGHAAAGAGFLLSSFAWAAIVAARWEGVTLAFRSSAFDDRLALVGLVASAFGWILWAHSDLTRRVSGDRGSRSVRRLRSRVFSSSSGRRGLIALTIVTLIAVLAPVLAPYSPDEIPDDTPAHRHRAPFESVTVFQNAAGAGVSCISWSVEGQSVVLDRGADFGELRVPTASLRGPDSPPDEDLEDIEHGETIRLGDREVYARKERYLLGTDRSGRDLLSRILYGTRVSLLVGFAAMLVAVAIGTLLGSLAGYFGGAIDSIVMRSVDVLVAFPRLVLLLVLVMAYPDAGIGAVILVIGLSGWMNVARLVRGEVLRIRELDFAVAARAIGASRMRTILRHLLPNASGPIVVAATLRVGDAILLEAALSFLGFGLASSAPTWGSIIESGRSALLSGVWWVSTLPGLMIVLVVGSVHLVGEAMRAPGREEPRAAASS